jgi:hypothetical protein
MARTPPLASGAPLHSRVGQRSFALRAGAAWPSMHQFVTHANLPGLFLRPREWPGPPPVHQLDRLGGGPKPANGVEGSETLTTTAGHGQPPGWPTSRSTRNDSKRWRSAGSAGLCDSGVRRETASAYFKAAGASPPSAGRLLRARPANGTSTDHGPSRSFEDRGTLLGEVADVSAMRDRFLHHANVLSCGPRSRRARQTFQKEETAGKARTMARVPAIGRS